jgi:hypothetical protein
MLSIKNDCGWCRQTCIAYQRRVFFAFTDRDYFIVYFLRKGLIEKFKGLGIECPLEHSNSSKFAQLIEPENFSVKLVDWTEEEFEMEDEDLVEMVATRKVCLESGKCVMPRDVGSNCCVF